MRFKCSLAAIALLLGTFVPGPAVPLAQRAATVSSGPKLVVLIVVDQMRADYVDRFQSEWTGGLKRMVTNGAWFRGAAYPYLTTVTCAGHATVSTGTFPHTHGIIQNGWWDRDAGTPVTCTSDLAASPISYGAAVTTADSAHRLSVPTFTDIMRSQRRAHVVTVSLKARSAIMLAGHGGDAVTWLSNNLDGWVTSSVFGNGPVPAVTSFVGANPIDADYGKMWERLLPAAHYHELAGAQDAFPHVLNSASNHPDAVFQTLWEQSPFADAYLGRFAAALVESMQLGKHDGIDVLGVGFSSPDLVGHAYGPQSQEVHDMYTHLDRTIGALLDRLDALVGPTRYVVGLTADHGVTEIPERLVAAGKDGGRLNGQTIATLIETRAQAALGPGKYLSNISGNDVYFQRGMYEKLGAAPSAIDSVIEALRRTAGIAAVFRAEELPGAIASKHSLLRAAALSYFPGRSGDLVLVPKPGWMFSASGTTHGTASDDDQRVPIVLFGPGIKRGVYSQLATPADVTPTLAWILGVTMPTAEGRALKEALAAPEFTGPTPFD
jgi:predicted AlkP superfamily pyrophosphatase or phosphodiesterase